MRVSRVGGIAAGCVGAVVLVLSLRGEPVADELLAYEAFDYERRQGHAGSEIPGVGIDGLDGGSGWSGSWTTTQEGYLNSGIPEGPGDYGAGETWGITLGARAEPLSYTDAFGNSLATKGNQVRTAFGFASSERRELAQPIGEPGSAIWLSFLAQAHGDSTADSRWTFLELSNNGDNRVRFGNVAPSNSGNWALELPDHPGGGIFQDAGENYRMSNPTFYLAKFEFPESDAGQTRISVWLNPPSLVREKELPPPLFLIETAYTTYNQVGIAGRYSVDFDEIRVGTGFGAVTPTSPSSDIPVAVRRDEEDVVVSWPSEGAEQFALQVSDDLQKWVPANAQAGMENGEQAVTMPMTKDREFYRLEYVQPEIPSPRLATLERAGWEHQDVREGVVYYEMHFDALFGNPQVINVLAVDLDHPDVRVELTANDVWGLTRTPTAELAEHAGAVAAINGGFAPGRRYEQVGYGFMKFRGKLWPFVNDPSFHHTYEAHGRNAVGIDEEGTWHFASRGEQGWEIGAKWDEDWPGMVDAMAGGSHLVKEGQVHPLVVRETTRGAYLESSVLHGLTFNRHPRTAIGVTNDRVAVLVTAAGRFPGTAAGMTLHEMADLMVYLGCRDALELDGGGSTTMWIEEEPFGGVVNYPTDNGEFDHDGERTLRLGVLVMERE